MSVPQHRERRVERMAIKNDPAPVWGLFFMGQLFYSIGILLTAVPTQNVGWGTIIS